MKQGNRFTVSLRNAKIDNAMSTSDLTQALADLAAPTKILLHAPTSSALARARGNFKNLSSAHPEAEIAIIVNAQAVQAIIDAPTEMGASLAHVHLCPNSLKNMGLEAPAHIQVLPIGAVDALARLQKAGWAYIRC